MRNNPMPTPAQREIVDAYNTVRQVGGQGTIVQRVAQFLGRKLDVHGDHSQIRRAINDYQKIIAKSSN